MQSLTFEDLTPNAQIRDSIAQHCLGLRHLKLDGLLMGSKTTADPLVLNKSLEPMWKSIGNSLQRLELVLSELAAVDTLPTHCPNITHVNFRDSAWYRNCPEIEAVCKAYGP